MNNVKLSAADRKYFAGLLDRSIPNPDSEAFDEFLEELRRMKPDVYSDLISKLTYSGEPLPVEKEARLASRRSTVQRAIDKVRNRRTHDGKTVSDKRKLIIGGLAGVGALFVWMTFGSMQGAYNPAEAKAQTQAEDAAESAPTQDTPPDDGFGVRAPRAQFAADLNIPEVPARAQTQAEQPNPKRTSDLPPTTNASSIPTAQRPTATRTAQPNDATLPEDDNRSTDLPPRNPADLPPQPTSVTAAPTSSPVSSSPYAPPTSNSTSGGTASATPEVLPTSLSFELAQQAVEIPRTLSSSATPADLNALADVQLSADVASEETETQANQSLSWENETATTTESSEAAPTLGWGNEATAAAAPSTLSTAQPAAATTNLPPVPQVGATPARTPPAQLQPIILANALPTGTEVEAELVTAVAATDQQGMPVLAKTTGKWCQRQTCPEITWIGEATYDGADRVNITFSQAVVGQNQQNVVGTAFDQDRLPGVVAHVGDGAPLAVQDLLRGAVGGASDYLNAVNTRTTTTVQDGVVVQEQAEPDLGNFLLGRSANLFASPSDQTSVIRYASLDEGQRITVIFGISL